MHLPAADPQRSRPLSRGARSTAAQVTRGQLRIYGHAGPIAPLRRTAAGRRDGAADPPRRMQAIRQPEDIGFALAPIGLLLSAGGAGQIDEAGLRAVVQRQLQSIDARIARLRFVRPRVATTAQGDLRALRDPRCRFLVHFPMAGARPPRRCRA